MVVLAIVYSPRNRFFLGSVTQSIAAMGGQSIAPTLEAGIKKDSGLYTFVQKA
jgi:hypothetical protein